MTAKYDLDHAYSIDGPEDARALYKGWAATYDESFGSALGYVAPRRVADVLLQEDAGAKDDPILDVGAGTGLVAEALRGRTVDGLDISSEMLAQAEAKAIYRRCILGDLTGELPLENGAYGAVISCGTFTHGHVGPVCLPELLRVTRPGGLFVCGTIPAVFDKMGFGSSLAILVGRGTITPVAFREIEIYEGVDHAHAKDRALVMVFRKI